MHNFFARLNIFKKDELNLLLINNEKEKDEIKVIEDERKNVSKIKKNKMDSKTINELSLSLFKAVKNNDSVFINNLIDLGANINKTDYCGNTPLHIAAKSGNIKIVKILTNNKKCNIDKRNKNGETPLRMAMQCKHYNIVKILADKGASIKFFDRNGNGFLTMAITHENYEAVQLAIDKKLNINHGNHEDETALHYAANYGYIEIIKLLIKAGARLNIVTQYQMTPLQLAIKNNRNEVVELLLKNGANPNKGGTWINPTAYELALKNKNYFIMNLLKEYGVDLNRPSRSKYRYPLIYAIKNSMYKDAETMVDDGVNVHIKDVWKNTPLSLCLKAKRLDSKLKDHIMNVAPNLIDKIMDKYK